MPGIRLLFNASIDMFVEDLGFFELLAPATELVANFSKVKNNYIITVKGLQDGTFSPVLVFNNNTTSNYSVFKNKNSVFGFIDSADGFHLLDDDNVNEEFVCHMNIFNVAGKRPTGTWVTTTKRLSRIIYQAGGTFDSIATQISTMKLVRAGGVGVGFKEGTSIKVIGYD